MTVLMYSDRMMPFESQNAEAVQSLHARECSQDWMMMCAPNRRRFKCLGEVSEGGAMVYLKSTLTDVDFITSKKKKNHIFWYYAQNIVIYICHSCNAGAQLRLCAHR